MEKIQKQRLLGLLIFAFLLMVLLTISLPALQMRPGELFSLQVSDPSTMSSGQEPIEVDWFFTALRAFLLILMLLVPVHIIISLFDKDARRKLLSDLLKFAVLALLVLSLTRRELPETPPAEPDTLQPGFADFSEFSGNLAPPPSFEANPQPWMLPLIMIVAALLLALITFLVLIFLSKRKSVDRQQFREIADNAQTALDDIEEAKLDFNDVITRCYAEMSQILQAENGIQRDQAMTTHEFEGELLLRGFPARPIQQLTQLFEQVRYGRQQPGDNEKQIAVESLSEIIAFCRAGRHE